MKGYKAFNSDWTCRDFQYEVDKTYELDGELKMCKNGFHFCENLIDCFRYYNFYDNIRIAEVEAMGDIIESNGNSKCCTNKIKIVREIDFGEMCEIIGVDEWKFIFMEKLRNSMVCFDSDWDGGSGNNPFYWGISIASSYVDQSICAWLKDNKIEVWIYDWNKRKNILKIQIQDKTNVLKEIEEDRHTKEVLEIVEKLLAE